METQEKIDFIKSWLGTGSINIFGLPMSGKDTVGARLAEALGAELLSSGNILRQYEAEHSTDLTGDGKLTPTNVFYDIVLPHFSHPSLSGKALVLSSVGRWSGEEDSVMEAAKNGSHPIKAVVSLELDEKNARERWETAKELEDRGDRNDDSSLEVFETRLTEFREKTLPVIEHYGRLGMLIKVDASQSRDEVFESTIDKIFEFIKGEENA